MIKKIILSFLISSLAFANYIDEFNKKNYKKALELAKAQCEIDCSDEKLNLILAKSAEKLKDTKEAIAAYDRVLIINENNIEARFSIANLYYENNNPELMRDELNYMLNNLDLSSTQKVRINNMLNNLDNLTKEVAKPYFIGLNLGFAYDTNPLYGNDNFTDFVGEKIRNFKNEKASGSLSFNFNIDGAYNLDLGNNYFAELYASLNNKKYLKNKSENYPDLNVLTLAINPSYIRDNHKITLNASYDFVLLRRAAFLHSLNMGINYENNVNDNYLYLISYDLSKGIFADSMDKDSNFIHHSLGLNNVFAYNDNIYYFNLNYDLENAKDSFSANSDFKNYGIKIGAIIPILNKVSFKPSFGYNHTIYKKVDSSYYSKRKDNEIIISGIFDYKLDYNQSLSFALIYDKQNSNHNFYDSLNYTSMISYRYEF
ncbi:hypothetical protein AVBRAN9334_02185 [Campylobacter sp. RM9334]|uniref:porin family protein n=1 Tax=Campylobacter sp. RM9334 TaxID=2735732 RepID=UPI001DF4973A|nr:hypothetical protein [Campylobacter sp. RM9334]